MLSIAVNLPQLIALHARLSRLKIHLWPGTEFPFFLGIQKFWSPYLAAFYGDHDRLRILATHYRYFDQRLGDPKKEVTVYTSGENEGYRVVLKPADRTNQEGESVLEFLGNGAVLYRLTFSIVPAAQVPWVGAEQDGIFIGGIQGGRDCTQALREAAKANHEIAPASVLLIALQAVAKTFGLNWIYGIKSADHRCESIRGQSERYSSLYDRFWESSGGTEGNFSFRLSAEPTSKDLSLVPRHHRARARRKREVKAAMLEAMAASVRQACRVPATIPRLSPSKVFFFKNTRHHEDKWKEAFDETGFFGAPLGFDDRILGFGGSAAPVWGRTPIQHQSDH